MRYLLAAALGILCGGAGGFLGAVLLLQARHLRNGLLLRRGLPAIRDALLTPLHLPGALLGGLFAPLCLGWFSLTAAILASALIPLSLALLLSVLIVAQGFGK